MRSSRRIGPFCDKLKELWRKQPDLRFGQLIGNALDNRDSYYIEDNEMLRLLEEHINGLPDPRNRPDSLCHVNSFDPNWRRPVIAIDFDGCLCANEYPLIGAPNIEVITEAKRLKRDEDACLILWTCRTGKELDEAIDACKKWGLEFDYINENAPWQASLYGGSCRKVAAWEYWDDASVYMGCTNWRSIRGASCSLLRRKDVRKFVDECLRPAIEHYSEEESKYAEEHPGEENPYFDFVSISREALEIIELFTTEMDEHNSAHTWYQKGAEDANDNMISFFQAFEAAVDHMNGDDLED